jgi:hypothetical protein
MYRSPQQSGPPAWLVILAAALLVFGGYFIWIGTRNYMGAGLQALIRPSPTPAAVQSPEAALPTLSQQFTPPPSRTPIPACQEFQVIVPEAIVRECASTSCQIADTRYEGDVVCVLEPASTDPEWYVVDLDDSQFFTTLAYMHESLLRPLNPTLTPSMTMTPLPTVTPTPSRTPLPTPAPTDTPEASATATITPTFTPSPTPPLVTG